jgi:hypothetical protein
VMYPCRSQTERTMVSKPCRCGKQGVVMLVLLLAIKSAPQETRNLGEMWMRKNYSQWLPPSLVPAAVVLGNHVNWSILRLVWDALRNPPPPDSRCVL